MIDRRFHHMMPMTRIAQDRIESDMERRRVLDHKAAIDAYLVRWDEPACTVEDAMVRMDDDARDAADEIMCARY